MSKRTVAFILSADRSGSTWVGYVLGSHAESAFLGEYYRLWDKELSRPCTHCAAKGLTECEILCGADAIHSQQAFSWAFERTGKELLVDNSKRIEWAGQFVSQSNDYEVRLIHLIRDPRGWYASERRRAPQDVGYAMRTWHDGNARIRDFAIGSGHPYQPVFYDELVADPVRGFRILFAFCGLMFSETSLNYWEFAHHSIAANGATSLTPPEDLSVDRLPHFLTGDDGFYANRRRKQFCDERWKNDLGPDEIKAITDDTMVQTLLSAFGRRLSVEGLEETRRSPWVHNLRRRVGMLLGQAAL